MQAAKPNPNWTWTEQNSTVPSEMEREREIHIVVLLARSLLQLAGNFRARQITGNAKH